MGAIATRAALEGGQTVLGLGWVRYRESWCKLNLGFRRAQSRADEKQKGPQEEDYRTGPVRKLGKWVGHRGSKFP